MPEPNIILYVNYISIKKSTVVFKVKSMVLFKKDNFIFVIYVSVN